MSPSDVSASSAWINAVGQILGYGERVHDTVEAVGHTMRFSAALPLIDFPARGANYRFMFAEAAYIIRGQNNIDVLSRVIPGFAKYSDNGYYHAGAYGPKVLDQLPYVLADLARNYNSRRAVLTIWNRSPYPSNDTPCTLSMQFLIRRGELITHVNMRSSDAWTGLYYDSFVFSCIASIVAFWLQVRLGEMVITAGSRHIYDHNIDEATHLYSHAAPEIPVVLEPMHPSDLLAMLDRAVAADKPLAWMKGELR